MHNSQVKDRALVFSLWIALLGQALGPAELTLRLAGRIKGR